MQIKIGELAKIANCPVVTIRYYEKEGLLTKPIRTSSNYRLYNEKDIERLRFVKHCRNLDMKLDEIRNLLTLVDNPKQGCHWVDTMIEDHIHQVEQQIKSLLSLKKQLQQLQQLQHKCGGDKKNGCGIIASLISAKECPHCKNFRHRLAEYEKK